MSQIHTQILLIIVQAVYIYVSWLDQSIKQGDEKGVDVFVGGVWGSNILYWFHLIGEVFISHQETNETNEKEEATELIEAE